MAVGWEYGVVAFLDVLGFSSFIERDAKSLHPERLERFLYFIDKAKSSLGGKEIDLKVFSDSIIISAPLSNSNVLELIVAVSRFQADLAGSGVLVRGGIAFGKHYCDETAIYSEALISAYILERDVARFPRVVLQDDLYDWFVNDGNTDRNQKESMSEALLLGRDKRIFVNYLNDVDLGEHLRFINSYEDQDVSARVLEKLQWLAEYHNYVAAARGLSSFHRGDLVESFKGVV